MRDIETRVFAVIDRELQPRKGELKPAASLMEDLGADSLDVVELVMELEREFDIFINDDDINLMTTVQDVLDLVNSRARNPNSHDRVLPDKPGIPGLGVGLDVTRGMF